MHTNRVRYSSLALLVLAACGGADTPAEERVERARKASGDVVVGVAWPWEARKGIRYGEGLDMAVEEINAAGGVNGRRLRLVRVDDKESVDEGRIVAQRLSADPEVVAVIGHLQSYVSVPAAAIYDLGGLVMLSPAATDPELTAQGYKRVFRATFTDKTVGRRMAEFAGGRGHRRVAIYYIRNIYGRGLANAFEERANDLGMSVVARQSYDQSEQASERTFEATLREWGALDLDAIFLAGEVPSAATFVAAARRQGITAPIIGGDALNSPALLSVAGEAAEGTIVASVFHPDEPRPAVQRFTEAFRKRFGAAPDAGSALGYDAVRLLAHAMTQAKSTVPDEVARSLHAVRGWQGVTGAFSFDDAGDLVDKPVVKMVVRGGKFEYVAEQPTVAQASAAR
jgi:branched-chain amino acid transport system substrate-binding protein